MDWHIWAIGVKYDIISQHLNYFHTHLPIQVNILPFHLSLSSFSIFIIWSDSFANILLAIFGLENVLLGSKICIYCCLSTGFTYNLINSQITNPSILNWKKYCSLHRFSLFAFCEPHWLNWSSSFWSGSFQVPSTGTSWNETGLYSLKKSLYLASSFS